MAKRSNKNVVEKIGNRGDQQDPVMPFGKKNYILFLIGIALLIVGYLLMIGGGSADPDVFSEDMYDFQRLTLSPILIVAGFVVEIFAIMCRPKNEGADR